MFVVFPLEMPGSLQAALHCTVTAAGYVDGVRATMRVGGGCASRASYIGACLAAKVHHHQNLKNPKILDTPETGVSPV